MTIAQKIRLVQIHFFAFGLTNADATGVIDDNTRMAVEKLRERAGELDEDETNMFILTFLAMGLNDDLVDDGTAGKEFNKALDAFLALGAPAAPAAA